MNSLAETSVLIAGLGNIGSPLAGLVARLGVGRVILVDRDRVEVSNVRAQDHRPEDVGRYKADVLAERLRSQVPSCDAQAFALDLEDLPHGVAQVDLVLGALDSRRARQALVSDIAWPLGVPVIDGGVGEGWRGRVQIFAARAGSACLECTWGAEDYRQLGREYPCVPGGMVEAPPTAAPAFLGSAVASTMAAEAARLLEGEGPTESREIAFDLLHRRHLVTRLRHNPHCRFRHEVVTRALTVPRDETAGGLLRLIESEAGCLFHLECRRGLAPASGFAPGRLLSRDWLASAGGTPIESLGFDERDLVRVCTPTGSLFVRFEP